MEVRVRTPNGPLYVDMDGVRVHSGFRLEVLRSALKYEPSPDDVFLVTYPKSGTTWALQIGYLIFHKGVPPPNGLDLLRSSPFLEMYGAGVIKESTRCGFIKTHLPYGLLRQRTVAKYIFVCRNPKDVCVSLFHHTRLFSAYEFADGKFEDFFEVFLKGDTEYGDYFDRVLSWYEHRNDPNVLFIHYEEMKANPRKYVLEIAKFMGEDHHNLLLKDQTTLRDVLLYSDLKYMKWQAEALPSDAFKGDLNPKKSSLGSENCRERPGFFRKGIIGDWKNYFSPEMNARMEEKIYRMLSHTDLIEFWRKREIM